MKTRFSILAMVLGVFGVIALSEAPAEAAPTEIGWADFSATQQECQWVCDRYEWVQHDECWTDGEEQYCDSWLESVCADSRYACNQVRKPLPDGDLINVQIERGVIDPSGVEFRLVAGPGITWWKEIMASGGSDRWTVWLENSGPYCNWPQTATPNCNTNSEWASVLLTEAGWIMFSKAKFLGIHTNMYILRDLSSQLHGGDRVTFTWVRD
jgi:hypothetical protein